MNTVHILAIELHNLGIGATIGGTGGTIPPGKCVPLDIPAKNVYQGEHFLKIISNVKNPWLRLWIWGSIRKHKSCVKTY